MPTVNRTPLRWPSAIGTFHYPQASSLGLRLALSLVPLLGISAAEATPTVFISRDDSSTGNNLDAFRLNGVPVNIGFSTTGRSVQDLAFDPVRNLVVAATIGSGSTLSFDRYFASTGNAGSFSTTASLSQNVGTDLSIAYNTQTRRYLVSRSDSSQSLDLLLYQENGSTVSVGTPPRAVQDTTFVQQRGGFVALAYDVPSQSVVLNGVTPSLGLAGQIGSSSPANFAAGSDVAYSPLSGTYFINKNDSFGGNSLVAITAAGQSTQSPPSGRAAQDVTYDPTTDRFVVLSVNPGNRDAFLDFYFASTGNRIGSVPLGIDIVPGSGADIAIAATPSNVVISSGGQTLPEGSFVPLDLGSTIRGTTPVAAPYLLTNFGESLSNVSISSVSASASTGSSTLGENETTTLTMSLPAASIGLSRGRVTVSDASNPLWDSTTFDLVASVLDSATPSLNDQQTTESLLIDFGTVDQASAPYELDFSIFNLATQPAFTADLELVSFSSVGDDGVTSLDFGSNFRVGAGGSESVTARLVANELGQFETVYTLSLSDDQTVLGAAAHTLTVAVVGTVIPEPSAFALACLASAALCHRRRASVSTSNGVTLESRV